MLIGSEWSLRQLPSEQGKEIELFSEDVALYSYMCVLDFRAKAILLT
jgi:hypothetical protein